jgi:hypothetical protein
MIIYERYREVRTAGIEPNRIINSFLTNGPAVPVVSGTPSSTNLVGNYSVTPINLDYTPGSGIHLINELVVSIQDTGTFDTGFYGNAITLTNGIRVYLRSGGSNVLQFTENSPILTNGGWLQLYSDFSHQVFGAGDEVFIVRVDFSGHHGGPLRLNSANSDTLRITLADNFTGLNIQTFRAKGSIE